jgi:hypothetical protein
MFDEPVRSLMVKRKSCGETECDRGRGAKRMAARNVGAVLVLDEAAGWSAS